MIEKPLIFDNPFSVDWKKIGLVDQVDNYDSEWFIETEEPFEGKKYWATGVYTGNELVDIYDIETAQNNE
jgi:hypothetical protein